MTTLYVRDFSCIDEAKINLSRMTILIGPQSSGKSVLSKLIYFFYDILSRQLLALEDQKTLKLFKAELAEEFAVWFPPSAWGKLNFVIHFAAGPYSARLTRSTGKHGRDTALVKFSSFLENEYNALLKDISARKQRSSKRALSFSEDFDLQHRIRSAAERVQKKELGLNFVDYQLFVPAGRSFFTNVGKAIAVFEQGGILDPLTLQFGRFFSSAREVGWLRLERYWRYQTKERLFQRGDLMRSFFGGVVRTIRDQQYIESDDGRKIPFSALSSGQQEILPLMFALEMSRRRERDIIYIEEPEAHLFPATQSLLVEYLAESIFWSKYKRMLITTHSPYILAKMNILAKAGTLEHFPSALNWRDSQPLSPRRIWGN